MPWYPKEQSNPITNLVSEINGCLGGVYFTSIMFSHAGVYLYSLNLTNFGVSQKKYGYMATDEPITYEAMLNYLTGILMGYRAAKSGK